MASDPSVGKEIGRVGEDEVEAPFGMVFGDIVHEGEAVGLVQPNAGASVFKHALAR